MTRQDFINEVQDISQLLEWADNFGYCFDEVYSEDSYDSEINDQLRNDDGDWRDVKSWLDDLPDGYDFYVRNRWGDWEGRNANEIDDLKDALLSWADNEDIFDEEEEGEDDWCPEEQEESEEPEEETASETDFTLDDLLSILWNDPEETA